MRLTPGARIGPYEIVSATGAGGMGEVYRARDSRLHRDVALKVLPEIFASDADRLARFDREARALAALSHPHIAGIHGIEECDNLRALALEFVDGETLADRIARGPIPIEEALPIARQIAEALEGAHEQGIIHRDLKPANIKITPAGEVKVLDFGLAKALESTRQDSANLPTITSASTRLGGILGTPAYMAPEQAKGKLVDRRCDIWAFGCVLFEMLTGHPPFEGDSATEVVANVLTQQPGWNRLPGGTPQPLIHLIPRCLDKDARQRLRDMGDARLELEEAERQQTATVPPRSLRRNHCGSSWTSPMPASGKRGFLQTWHRVLDEPPRQLLRQRAHGELVLDGEERTGGAVRELRAREGAVR